MDKGNSEFVCPWGMFNSPMELIFFIIASIIVLLVIYYSIYLSIKKQKQLNTFVQTMLQIVLCLSSIYLGYIFNANHLKQQATEKWLPAAESACNDLLSLQSSIRRLYDNQEAACNTMTPLFDKSKEKDRTIQILIKQQCDNSQSNLMTMEDQVENTIDLWLRFIESNCLQNECDRIQKSIDKRRRDLILLPNDSTETQK